MGVREWVGLLLLAVGVVIAASFYFPDSGSSAQPRAPSRGQVTTRTRTAVPEGAPIVQPNDWTIAVTRGSNNLPIDTSVVHSLEIAYDDRPLAELEDDDWGVAAEGRTNASAGRHTFRIAHLGSIRVYVNGELTTEDPAPDNDDDPPETAVNFIQASDGPVTIRIEARAHDNHVSLAWR